MFKDTNDSGCCRVRCRTLNWNRLIIKTHKNSFTKQWNISEQWEGDIILFCFVKKKNISLIVLKLLNHLFLYCTGSLAEQLKQVLAERERRMSSGSCDPHQVLHSSMNSTTRLGSSQSSVPQSLVEEIRHAVAQANLKGEIAALCGPRSECIISF